MDRLLWAWLSRLWQGGQHALAFVQPRMVIVWQRTRCRDHWRRLSQGGPAGRPTIATDVRERMRDLWRSEPPWGSPRIVGELRKLGMPIANSTVEKDRVRSTQSPSPTWKTFLKHHGQELVSLDCCVGPTLMHQVLVVRLIRTPERRRVVHVHGTAHPTAEWTTPQGIDAFPWDEAPRYLLRDRDRLYGTSCRRRVRNLGIEDVLIAPRSPWQHPYGERLLGSLRRDDLDHGIVLHARHLRRLLPEDFRYDHDWRTRRARDMDCPVPRPVQRPALGVMREVPAVGGLHHHSERRAA
jgi:putative transposase